MGRTWVTAKVKDESLVSQRLRYRWVIHESHMGHT